ncbi:CpaF family protein [Comamonas aquatilis]|uniref:CpaF family protein n=1 Tax=Comamonas aquatilis TaxID=1778406 RepID=UPI0039EDEF3A
MSMDIVFAAQTSKFSDSKQLLLIKNVAHEHLLTRVEELGAIFAKWSVGRVRLFVQQELDQFVRQQRFPVNDEEVQWIAQALIKELSGLGPLDDLMADPEVEDILINGYERVFVSRRGVLKQETLHFTDNAHVLRIVRRIISPLGRRLDESTPMVDARLPDGGRINVVIEPLSLDGPAVSIRKFRNDPLKVQDMVQFGTLDEGMAKLLELAVRERCNILISGGTSCGKTSMLNAIAGFIPENERVVTIEDTAELTLPHPHVVRMESRPGGFDGAGVVSIRDLLRNSLRMRPDRIVVGEVRGAEVLEMLQAMNTGHDGSMATIHASSARECLHRMEMLAGFAGFQGSETSLRRQISNALDFIVQISRLPNGKRRITSITEVTGIVDNVIATQELYRHEFIPQANGEDLERWTSMGLVPHTPKLARYRAVLQHAVGNGVRHG